MHQAQYYRALIILTYFQVTAAKSYSWQNNLDLIGSKGDLRFQLEGLSDPA
jgi:hypothetical protein